MKKQNSMLKEVRQIFSKELSIKDPSSTVIRTFELVTCMVFHFMGQAKDFFTLESIRRALMVQTDAKINSSSFHERIGTNKLNLILYNLFTKFTSQNLALPLRGKNLCQMLGVKDIYLQDSATLSLYDRASSFFPGTFQKSALKWHFCFSILSGSTLYSDYSSASSHDIKHFPKLSLLKNSLILVDLGYYCFSLFQKMKRASVFFFSRVKEGSALKIVSIKEGLPTSCIGMTLSELEKVIYYRRDIDAVVEVKHKKETFQFRLVGFFNKKERHYHFYITNLEGEVKKLRKLYNLRWQVELFFKGSRQSISLGRYPSGKPEIIMNLFFVSLIAAAIGMTLFQIGCEYNRRHGKEEDSLSISVQRVFLVLNLIAPQFKAYILEAFDRKPELPFEEKVESLIHLFSDPNKERMNSLQQILILLLS